MTALLFFIVAAFILLTIIWMGRSKQSTNRGHSYSVSVSALDAVLSNKMFGKLSGIKNSEEGKPFVEWSEAEKKKWHKEYYSKIVGRTYVYLTYLGSEDAYFIKSKEGSTLVLQELGKRNLYYSCLIGEDNPFEDHLEFCLVERIIGYKETKIKVITGYLREHNGKDNDKSKTIILFDFPTEDMNMTEEDLKDLGFKIKRWGDSWPYEDMFGDMATSSIMVDYMKNGCKISNTI